MLSVITESRWSGCSTTSTGPCRRGRPGGGHGGGARPRRAPPLAADAVRHSVRPGRRCLCGLVALASPLIARRSLRCMHMHANGPCALVLATCRPSTCGHGLILSHLAALQRFSVLYSVSGSTCVVCYVYCMYTAVCPVWLSLYCTLVSIATLRDPNN